ncbi:hypothetical protein C8R44DRAFT_821456 [Mycena epipterygia]|nr:hypothetical protein C8R44DRAFT_821456 [Mycena epipterygia]
MDIHHSRADCMLRLGDIAKDRGDSMKAEKLWKEARSLFERSSQVKDIAQIDTRLASINKAMSSKHQEAPDNLTKMEALTTLLDEVSTVQEKAENTASRSREEMSWVAA